MKMRKAEIPYVITDKRSAGTAIKAEFIGELRGSQKKVVSAIIKHDNGIDIVNKGIYNLTSVVLLKKIVL